ncbi:MAG TPA: imidazole glycerol phosphate synthase subunit HisH [Candidatus Hydrogenedentes bacterium]|nr:imidazole glycerol phosphate synthase subunit HisH [Candidatus Hydrogenedentota bacterium]HOK89793.1 imidazole glycerol phosphate synthase subunit HisH [Candidatus Hydrogenedentota bacterium]HPO30217.1 imidazole glycerol phosphate synthase subunit HisH [Candidatus Hydrogenedentota bacterium]
MKVTIIDYGAGNLGSIIRAFESLGTEVILGRDPVSLAGADALVLPGVGAFAEAMMFLDRGGWLGPLREAVLERRVPVLGICLGMQLMATRGEEGGNTPGLNWLDGGVVRRLCPSPESGARLPHIGWNDLTDRGEHPIFAGIPAGATFYFAHSYHVDALPEDRVLCRSSHGVSFAAAVARDHILGVQFHPEKSYVNGLRLLRNFLEFAGRRTYA